MNLYKKIETKIGVVFINIGNLRCITSEDHRVLEKDDIIKERWMSYFHKLFNKNHIGEPKIKTTSLVRLSEVKDAPDDENRESYMARWYSY